MAAYPKKKTIKQNLLKPFQYIMKKIGEYKKEDIILTDPVLCQHQDYLTEGLEIDREEFLRYLLDSHCLDSNQVEVIKSESTVRGARQQLLKALQQNIYEEKSLEKDPDNEPIILRFIECLARCPPHYYLASSMLRKTYETYEKMTQ
jgi:hypothetical protein